MGEFVIYIGEGCRRDGVFRERDFYLGFLDIFRWGEFIWNGLGFRGLVEGIVMCGYEEILKIGGVSGLVV